MKKLLLTLGSIAAVAAPVASVVACGAPAKPAPKAIDNKVATKLAAKIAKGLGSTDTTDPAVKTLPNGNFEFTFNMPTKPSDPSAPTKVADITITTTGTVVAAKLGTEELTGDHLKQVKELAKAATENHDNDSLEKFDFDASALDSDIVTAMSLTPPADITETDYDSVNTYNEAVTAFNKAYKEEIAQETYDLLMGGLTITKTTAEITALNYADQTLDDATVDALGITGDSATKLKQLIFIGAEVRITTAGAGQVNGSVLGMKEGSDSSINWIQGTTSNPGATGRVEYAS